MLSHAVWKVVSLLVCTVLVNESIMSAFTSLELGKDERTIKANLSLNKNPLLVSIIDGCETLKALVDKSKITPEHISTCKGLILMRTDKVKPYLMHDNA